MKNLKKIDTLFFNPQNKNLKWHNRNYYYATTILFMVLITLTFFFCNKQLQSLLNNNIYWNLIFNPLRHADIGHLVGNLISFFVVSLFLERHFGSIWYLLIILCAMPLSGFATFSLSGSWNWVGESGVNYFLYSVFLVTIIFNFKNYFINKYQWIFTTSILSVLLLILCWEGSTSDFTQNFWAFFKFGWLSDLTHNVAHWSSAICGLIVTLFYYVALFGNNYLDCQNREKPKYSFKYEHLIKPFNETLNENTDNTNKKDEIIMQEVEMEEDHSKVIKQKLESIKNANNKLNNINNKLHSKFDTDSNFED